MRKELRNESGRLVQLETEPSTDSDIAEAAQAGLSLTRCVEQLRVELPLTNDEPPLLTRPFQPGVDDESFLRVNNRAFAWHPEQSDWTSAQLHQRMAEPWFDPQGFLLHDIDGQLAGFCWTKIHPPSGNDPELGEIFVVAVDPAFHRHGLGRALTCAGLASLSSRSVKVGMLHVEHDNVAARNLYERIGFHLHSRHCWWALDEGSPS